MRADWAVAICATRIKMMQNAQHDRNGQTRTLPNGMRETHINSMEGLTAFLGGGHKR